MDSMGTDTLDRDSINAISLEISRYPVDCNAVSRGSMTARLVVVVDLTSLHYSTVQVLDAKMDCLNEAVFGCSKVCVATRFAITGHYTNQHVMAAMCRVMAGTGDPMVAILRVMACKICHAEADYHCEVAMAAAVKQGAITRVVMAQDVMMARDSQV
jgi:hypothetical protein